MGSAEEVPTITLKYEADVKEEEVKEEKVDLGLTGLNGTSLQKSGLDKGDENVKEDETQLLIPISATISDAGATEAGNCPETEETQELNTSVTDDSDLLVVDPPPKPLPDCVDLTDVTDDSFVADPKPERKNPTSDDPVVLWASVPPSPSIIFVPSQSTPCESLPDDDEEEIPPEEFSSTLPLLSRIAELHEACFVELKKLMSDLEFNPNQKLPSTVSLKIIATELPLTTSALQKIPGFPLLISVAMPSKFSKFLEVTKKYTKEKTEIYESFSSLVTEEPDEDDTEEPEKRRRPVAKKKKSVLERLDEETDSPSSSSEDEELSPAAEKRSRIAAREDTLHEY